MSRPQLNIKFDGDKEQELLDTIKARAQSERVSLKDFVIDALKTRLQSPQSSKSSQASPSITNSQMEEMKRRLCDIQISFMGEIRNSLRTDCRSSADSSSNRSAARRDYSSDCGQGRRR